MRAKTESGFVSGLRARHRFTLLMLLQLAAFWPVWRWYALRLTDGSDEPWGVVALITAGLFFFAESRRSKIESSAPPATALLFAGLYLVTYAFVPPLVRAIFAVSSIGAMLAARLNGRSTHAGLGGLLLLSLPVIATMQFYLGYPLRAATALITAQVLKLGLIDVEAQGAILRIGGRAVWVDAPCAGIRMLWMASYLCCVLICLCRLEGPRAYLLTILGAASVFVANCVRAAMLFFLEVNIPGYPPALHSLVGILSFASVATILVLLSRALASKSQRAPVARRASRFRIASFAAVLLLAGCAPGLDVERPVRSRTPIAWPTELDGRPLVPLALSERELRFQKDFPGEIRRFRAGDDEVIVRAVETASRQLHPSANCLRALGYDILPAPAELEDNVHRGCFTAERGSTRMRVCEYIEDSRGEVFPDVSSWYWAALRGTSQGPWMAYTTSRAERN